ncbi:ribonuclease 2-5A family protein [Musa troglodytarum]|uniref:non-specific serine/threonine protein kinase n=1 Tax=Musa troglodytarum TaxID=320322 RepID=A0A9E7EDK9_9LILI|nr:ribonuclease 2-5A family protein [Musa troglodytarum]
MDQPAIVGGFGTGRGVSSFCPGSQIGVAIDKEVRFFLALPNGTIYFMNKSTKSQWKLLIGQPLSYSWRSPSNDDPDYIVFSDSNGELYEYSKYAGIRKHDWTVEEYVQRAPVVEGSVVTTGTKTSTFYFVDADSEELIYHDNEPFSLPTVGVPTAKEHVHNVGPGLTNTMYDEMEISSVSRRNIPVYFIGETDQLPKHKVNGIYSFIPDGDSDGRWVGRLFVTNIEIGHGSNGTVVFEGFYGGRPVAVKRLLRTYHDVAFKEIQNLIASDRHPNIVRDVVSGLAHLHELGIIHRDLKPQNVLISNDRYLNAKLSDMGISKRLLEDMSSLSRNATGYGTSGWQAPEQLLHGPQTRAMDLFNLGCILFFCITKGKHPFGNHFERDANIIHNRMDLFLVDHIPETEHLLCQLLQPDPKMRQADFFSQFP